MKPKSNANQSSPATRSSTRAKGSVRSLAAVRVEAEAAKAQLQAMQALTDTALSRLALDDLLRELLGRVTGVMGVDNVSVFLLQDDQTLTLRAARGLEEEVVGRVQVAVGQAIPGRIAASRVPLVVNDLSASDLEGAPTLVQERLRARRSAIAGAGSSGR